MGDIDDFLIGFITGDNEIDDPVKRTAFLSFIWEKMDTQFANISEAANAIIQRVNEEVGKDSSIDEKIVVMEGCVALVLVELLHRRMLKMDERKEEDE